MALMVSAGLPAGRNTISCCCCSRRVMQARLRGTRSALEHAGEPPTMLGSAKLLANAEPNIHPYLSSFWLTLRFRLKDQYQESGLRGGLQKLHLHQTLAVC